MFADFCGIVIKNSNQMVNEWRLNSKQKREALL